MPSKSAYLPWIAVLSALLACAAPPAAGGDGLATSVAATLTAAVPSASPTVPPTPEPAPLPPRLYKSYASGGDTAWWLQDGVVTDVTLPVNPGQYYDYSPKNGQILYASHFASVGVGPSNLAASDLWMVPYPSGDPTVLIPDDIVVEALWTPDGNGVVYILATPETYELRHRLLTGEDTLLASNVSPTWSVSPTGNTVAFTRETGYNVPGAPGLFVVPMAGGPETMLSDVDRHGTGSVEDRPIWSADGERVALPNYGFAPGNMVLANVDGSGSAPLVFSPELASDAELGSVPTSILWHPDGQHLIGFGSYSSGMGGPSHVMLYGLAPDGFTVDSAATLADGYALIDWNVPGRSLFILDTNSQPALVTLP